MNTNNNTNSNTAVNEKTSSNEMTLSTSLALVPLWATAFLLAALVIWQSAQLSPRNTARAEMAAVGSDFSMLTTDSGNGEILTILNNRNGSMYVYEVNSSSGVVLVDRLQVAEIIDRLSREKGK